MRKILPIFLCLAGLYSTAQDKKSIATDRPSQSTSSSLVPKGTFQIEKGLILERDNNSRGSNFNTLVRWGVNEFLELRFQQDYLSTKTSTGLSPTRLGIKSVIAKEEGWMPEIAFIGNLILESGESIYQSKNSVPEFRFSTSKSISNRFSIGYNLGMEWDDDSPATTTFYTIIFGASFGDKIAGFLEPYGFIREDSQTDSRLNVGVTYLSKSNMQLDVSGGFGITKNAPDSFIGFGCSVALNSQ